MSNASQFQRRNQPDLFKLCAMIAALALPICAQGAGPVQPPVSTPTQPPTDPEAEFSGLSLLSFRASGLYLRQPDQGGSVSTGMASWAPQYRWGSGLGVQAQVGGTLLKNPGGSLFPMIEASIMASYRLPFHMGVEAGALEQLWFDNTKIKPGVAVGLFYQPGSRVLGLVDRVFADYGQIFVSGNSTQVIRLGIELRLGGGQ